jgi:hypothetical protein
VDDTETPMSLNESRSLQDQAKEPALPYSEQPLDRFQSIVQAPNKSTYEKYFEEQEQLLWNRRKANVTRMMRMNLTVKDAKTAISEMLAARRGQQHTPVPIVAVDNETGPNAVIGTSADVEMTDPN